MGSEKAPSTRQFNKGLVKYYNKVLAGRLDELDDLVTLLRGLFDYVENRAKEISKSGETRIVDQLHELYSTYAQGLKEGIHGKFAERVPGACLFDHTSLTAYIGAEVDKFPSIEHRIQDRDRFYNQKSDGFFIKLIKPFKRITFNISVLPRRLGNVFKKVFKKKVRPITYWSYNLPLRGLIAYWFEYKLMKMLVEHFNAFMRAHNGVLNDMIALENRANQQMLFGIQNPNRDAVQKIGNLLGDLELLEKRIVEIRDSISPSASLLVSDCEKQLHSDREKAGTFELPARNFSERKRKDRVNTVQQLLSKTNGNWYNSVFLAYRDWNMDLDIYALAGSILKEKTSTWHIFTDRIKTKLIPRLSNIRKVVDELETAVDTAGKDPQQIRKDLLKAKVQVQKEFEPGLTDTLSRELLELDFPGLINGMDTSIRKLLDQLAPEFWLIKKDDLRGPVKEADFSIFPPLELLQFESIPFFDGELSKVRVSIVQQIEKIRNQIESLPKILAFNLETAYEALDGDEQQVEQGLGLINEAFDRVSNKIEDISAYFDEFLATTKERNDEVIRLFNERILLLADNENALEIRLRLTKAKALKRTVEFKEKILGRGLELLKTAGGKAKEYWGKILYFVRPWQRKVGLTGTTHSITSEVSDFLLYSSQAIDRLPLVYRKLYSIQPLISNELFVGRSAEISKMGLALTNWEQQRVASSVVVGEKWSGLTSLINHFLSLHSERYRSIRLRPRATYFKERQFLQLWCEPLQTDGIENPEQLISLLKNLPGKLIIVVEDIQDLYLREVGGFENLKLLSRIISATSQNIFWLCSCTRYAWSYLDLVIGLSEHFGYVVELEDMKSETITDVILKRNNISGYRIKYLPSDKVTNNKKYAKLTSSEKQEFLQELFFAKLNEFARSNISLALLYWLLSTKDISEDSLQIGSFEKPDFSFMDHMPLSKTLGVFMVVLHDGLSAEHFARVLDMDIDSAEFLLIQLVEDGILVEISGHYTVNTLLYRPAVNMLKTKNLIY